MLLHPPSQRAPAARLLRSSLHLPGQIKHVGNSPGSINTFKELQLLLAAIKIFLRKLSIFRCDKTWHRHGLNSFKQSVFTLALFSN